MYELKKITKPFIIIDPKTLSLNDDILIIKNCCERDGLLLLERFCYGSHVAIDANDDRFALVIRKRNEVSWVEYSKLRKNQKLDFCEG
jgi:hypothetical protein